MKNSKRVRHPKVELLGKLPDESLKFSKGVVYVLLKFKVDKKGRLIPQGHKVLEDQRQPFLNIFPNKKTVKKQR